MKCECSCHYSELGYCILNNDLHEMIEISTAGPNGKVITGMKCKHYGIKDKSELRTK